MRASSSSSGSLRRRSALTPRTPRLLLVLLLTSVSLPSSSWSLASTAGGGGIPQCVFDGISCECIVRSTHEAPKAGNFTSPNYPNLYPRGTRCLYKFVGLPHERVQVRFHDFAVIGSSGRCQQDYVDVFVKIDHPDHSIFEVPLHDRYCGQGISAVPHLLMSWNRTLIMTFISDDSLEDRGFQGTYTFIDGAPYRVGTPRSSGTLCAFTLSSSSSRSSGSLLAPLYPAMYTDDIECQYQFEGRPGERVKVTFEDFSLYHGGDHCPFDYVQIFDSDESTDDEAEIAKYCGRQPRFSVYSSKQFLTIKFKTRSGRNLSPSSAGNAAGGNATVYAILRGFNASYEFSSDFVNLDYMPPGVVHVKGSECDTRVTSAHSPGGGEITSPNFPLAFPPNVTCYYYIDGRQLGSNNFERPSIEFLMFDMPSVDPECRRGSHLATYLYGQDATVDSADRYLCNVSAAVGGGGSPAAQHPAVLTSHANRLTLKFDTRGARILSIGFQARFRFITNESAPTAQPPACQQTIRSGSQKQGTFAFPSSRASTIGQTRGGRCSYDFQPAPDEYVVVSFDAFDMGAENGAARASPCHTRRTRMDVSFSTPGRNASSVGQFQRSYCGSRLPGILTADDWAPASIHLAAIVEHRSSVGGGDFASFSGFYMFAPVPRASERCGANYVDMPIGVISSPGYPVARPGFVDCVWRISTTKPGSIIDLTPLDMDMAGGSEGGCKNAVLKVYKGEGLAADYELCGRERDQHEPRILSSTGLIRLRYIALVQQLPPGGRTSSQHKGFKLRWQILSGSSPSCSGHVCNVTRTCLPEHLVCNKQHDCGNGDTSDEEGCDSASSRTGTAAGDSSLLSGDILYVIVGVATVVVAVIVAALVAICMCIRRLQRRADDAKPASASNGTVTASSISAPICTTAATQHGISGAGGHVPATVAGHNQVGSVRPPSDVMITSYPPPMAYPGLGGVSSGYLSLGRPYTRCPSTSSSSGGRAMTNSTWLSGRDVDNMPCLTVL